LNRRGAKWRERKEIRERVGKRERETCKFRHQAGVSGTVAVFDVE
jgi:hypothetical protein